MIEAVYRLPPGSTFGYSFCGNKKKTFRVIDFNEHDGTFNGESKDGSVVEFHVSDLVGKYSKVSNLKADSWAVLCKEDDPDWLFEDIAKWRGITNDAVRTILSNRVVGIKNTDKSKAHNGVNSDHTKRIFDVIFSSDAFYRLSKVEQTANSANKSIDFANMNVDHCYAYNTKTEKGRAIKRIDLRRRELVCSVSNYNLSSVENGTVIIYKCLPGATFKNSNGNIKVVYKSGQRVISYGNPGTQEQWWEHREAHDFFAKIHTRFYTSDEITPIIKVTSNNLINKDSHEQIERNLERTGNRESTGKAIRLTIKKSKISGGCRPTGNRRRASPKRGRIAKGTIEGNSISVKNY